MKKIKLGDVLPHVLAIGVFLVVTLIFFSPLFFENKTLDQHDIQQYVGSSKALHDYREATGEEGLWAGNMFSGMPAYLVNVQWSDGVMVGIKKVMSLFLPHPVRNIFLAFVCYYIMLLVFRVRPYLAIAGALAFGLSSYIIIGLSAGHNARIGAIAFMPLVVAGIHLVFSNKKYLGFAVTTLGLALHLRENHLQITYYLVLIVLVYGLVQLIYFIRSGKLVEFFKTVVLIIPAIVLAVGTFFGPLWAIEEYRHYSIRGPSELATNRPASDTKALSKEYAFSYKYGVWESMVLMIPDFYGGSSAKSFVEDQTSATYQALVNSGDNALANKLAAYASAYWGPQDFAGGSYYAGAIIIFLFVLGILLADKKYVWWLVPLSALSLMLSWGDSFSSFNYFMFDYLPGYNKFRSVNFALVIILFCMPLLGMIGLEKFMASTLNQELKRKLLIAFGATGGVCLLLAVFAGMGSFVKEGESQLPVWFLKALTDDRRGLLRDDAIRSFSFILAVFIMLYFNVGKRISQIGFYAFLGLVITFDASMVDKRYFTKANYQRKRETKFEMSAADQAILQDKSYYRVYNLNGTMAEARTSYYHNSIGGYHGAKMRRYLDLYDSAIVKDTQTLINSLQSGNSDFNKLGVLNMLNVKYIVYGPEVDNVIPNPAANGSAWFVKQVEQVKSPNEELKRTSEVNTRETAVVNASSVKLTQSELIADSAATVTILERSPKYLKYESNSASPGLIVFSEIYYPKGWHATVDRKDVPILRADYVLRALEVAAGKHVIEFKFEPRPYIIGNKVTMVSSWVLLIAVMGSLAMGWRKEMQD
ncbi:MAG: YfhO family protein [Cyclobacteriaceae bacterium]|nr:YfhO family protein [Cyclobacteriaceae bacterium]